MTPYLSLATRNLLQARRRSLLLSLALGCVAAVLVLLLSLSLGVRETLAEAATLITSGHVNVAGFYKAKPADAFPMVSETPRVREVVKSTLGDDLLAVVDRGRGWGKVLSETEGMQVAMAGIEVSEEQALLRRLQLAEQREYRADGAAQVVGNAQHLAQPNTVLVFVAQAKRLGVDVGDKLTLTTETMSGAVNTSEVRVVAVARDIGFMTGWNVIVPKAVLLELYQLNADTSGAVLVYLKDRTQAWQAMERLHKGLEQAGFRLMEHVGEPFWQKFSTVAGEDWVGQKLDLTLWEDEVSYMQWVIRALDAISFFLVGILLIIIGVGIMNAMWMVVRERTREIGTLRAIGMGRRQVLIMLITEAFVLGCVATGSGALLGALLAWGLDVAGVPVTNSAMKAVLMSDTVQLVVRAPQIVGAVVTMTAFTVASALWPSLKATRLRPITAIHRIG